MRYLWMPIFFLLTACAPTAVGTAPLRGSAVPYLTVTPSLTSTPNVLMVVETPIPTGTPFVYTIVSGDTFSELAEQFKISQDALRAANPSVMPNSMSVGSSLLIPPVEPATANSATLTPIGLPISQCVCHASKDGGLWCFGLINNPTPGRIENLAARISLLDEQGANVTSQIAFPPLDAIPANAALPVLGFFPNTSPNVFPQIQVLSAIPASAETSPEVKLDNIVTRISWDGLSAQVQGDARVSSGTQIWIAAVVYNQNQQISGVKRWEGTLDSATNTTHFNFMVASLNGVIERVDLVAEVKP